MRPNWENECVSKSALIEWLRPYLHTGEPIPADVLISDIQMMPPTLTPPEIVCCQDCVHHEDGYAHWCNKWEHTCPDDSEFFCKFGRKKNDSTTD